MRGPGWSRGSLILQACQIANSAVRHAVASPTGHGDGAQALVKSDRALIPIENGPFQATAAAIDCGFR